MVSVTPNSATTRARPANSGGFSETFTVENTGLEGDTYTITCASSGNVTCTGTSTSSVTLFYGGSTSVSASYSVGAVGSGGLTLTARGTTGASSTGGYTVPISADGNTPPTVSLTPHNASYRDVSKCVAACFDLIASHATPVYTSLGAARSFSLVYNSSTHKPTPVVQLDVSNQGDGGIYPYPTTRTVQVRLASSGALLTLLNGTQTVYYAAGTTQTARLVAALDAQANGLSTGAYAVNVTVTSNYATGSVQSTTVSTRLLVDDESRSVYGVGVTAAGVQRLYLLPGSSSVVITEGDGSIIYYDRACSTCVFVTPDGTSASLTYNSGTATYRRAYLDSTFVEFNATGRMTRAVDRFGNQSTLTYTDTLLTAITDPMGKVISLNYTGQGSSASGKLQSATDPAGRTTVYWTDAAGKLYKVTDPDSYATTFSYSASGLLATVTDRAGQSTDYAYDGLNRISSIAAPPVPLFDGSSVRPTTTFTAAERVVWQPAIAGTTSGSAKALVRADTVWASTTDPLNATTKYALDKFGAATTVARPINGATTLTRDNASRPTFVTEPDGHQTRYTYLGYLLTTVEDLTTGAIIGYTYNTRNDLITISGTVSRMDYYYYTGADGGPAGGLKRVTVGNTGTYSTPVGARVLVTHYPDSRGRDTLLVDSLNHATRFLYDLAWGNVQQTIGPSGSVTHVHYDNAGRADTTSWPNSGPWSMTYGLLNQVVSQRDPLGQTTQWQYHPASLALEHVVDPKGQVYKFTSTALGQLVTRHDLADSTKADTLKYDRAGNLRTVRTRRGDLITMTYDSLGRLLTRSGPDFPADTFRYGPNGRWEAGVNANAYDSLHFDVAGRVDTVVQKVHNATFTVTYEYDSHGRVTKVSVSSNNPPYTGYTRYGYESSRGTLDTLCAEVNCVVVTRSVELLDSVLTYTPSPGTAWSLSRAFGPRHELLSQVYPASLSQFGATFARDSLGRVTRRTPTGATPTIRRYAYDALGRLVNACDSASGGGSCVNEYAGTGTAYSYDAAGNRTEGGAGILAGNRTGSFNGSTLGYDGNGNIVSKVRGAATYGYSWDALGRLTQVTSGGSVAAAFRYDAFGRRVLKVSGADSLWFVYDVGAQVLLDVLGQNATTVVKAEYNYGSAVDNLFSLKSAAGAVTAVALTDPDNGSVRGLATWDGGTLIKSYLGGITTQTPWGATTADTGLVVRYRFAGREYDQETGLYYMRARYYDPQLGRFMSEDPIGLAGGINLYAYVANDPANSSDPFGLEGCAAGYQLVIEIDLDAGTMTFSCESATGGEYTLATLGAVTVDPVTVEAPKWPFSTPRDQGANAHPSPRGSDAAIEQAIELMRGDLLNAGVYSETDMIPAVLVPIGTCIGKYTSTPLGVGLLANAGASVAAGGKGGYILGSSVQTGSWAHRLGMWLDGVLGSDVFSGIGKWFGRAGFGVTGLVGGYDLGIEAQCAAGAIR